MKVQMKPETIERRRVERIAEQAAQVADLRARLIEAAATEAAKFPPDLWIYAGPDGMLAEHRAAHPEIVEATR